MQLSLTKRVRTWVFVTLHLARSSIHRKAQCYYFNGDPYEASADPCMQHQNSTYIFKRIFVYLLSSIFIAKNIIERYGSTEVIYSISSPNGCTIPIWSIVILSVALLLIVLIVVAITVVMCVTEAQKQNQSHPKKITSTSMQISAGNMKKQI